MQFITNFKDIKIEGLKDKAWSPSTKIWIQGNQLFTRIRQGGIMEEDNQWFYIADISKNVWHTVVLGAQWSDTKNGFFKFWYDGNLKLQKNHIANTIKADNRF